MSDRQYVRLPGHAWHAWVTWTRVPGTALTLCGRSLHDDDLEESDRVPSSGHLCGNCGRLIAAHTDYEDSTDFGDMGNVVAPI